MTKVVLFGDPDSTQDAEDIYAAVAKEENVDLYVNEGDNGYHEEFEPVKALIDKHFPPGSEKRKKLRILLGNHDHEESEGPKAEPFFGELFPDLYKTQPGFEEGDSSWENPKWLWSEHLNDELAFIGMNSQDEDIGFKRNQYNWTESQINKFKELRKQNKCRWILAGVHKPWVTKKSSHSAYTNHREVYGDLFFNVVNQMWFGHNHNDHIFRSWKAIKKEGNAAIEIIESLLSDGKTIDHSKQHGMTGNINGHSGHEHNKFKEAMDVPEIIWYNDSVFSYAVVETNDKILNTKYKGKDGNVLFEYNISDTTDYSNGGTPPGPDPCPDPNQCKDKTTGECRNIGFNEQRDPATGDCIPTTPTDPTDPTTPDIKDPICEEGYELKIIDGVCKCVKKAVDNHGCGINEVWNEELQQCIPVLKPKFEKCPDGQFWDYNQNKCVTNSPENKPPVVDAGLDKTVHQKITIALNGSKSYDPNGDPLTKFGWIQSKGEPKVQINKSDTLVADFISPDVPADKESIELEFTLQITDSKGASAQDSVLITVKKEDEPPGPQPEGNLIWSSAKFLANGTDFTVEDTYGKQGAGEGGIYTAASGDPFVEVKKDGTVWLCCKKGGHPRFYIKVNNYNWKETGWKMFPDDKPDDFNTKGRNRHNMGGDCENRQGGLGFVHQLPNQIKSKLETCHNEHDLNTEGETSKNYEFGKWYYYENYLCDVEGGTRRIARIDMNGKSELPKQDEISTNLETVIDEVIKMPPAFYKKDVFEQESEFWHRMNPAGAARAGLFDAKIYKIEATDLPPKQ